MSRGFICEWCGEFELKPPCGCAATTRIASLEADLSQRDEALRAADDELARLASLVSHDEDMESIADVREKARTALEEKP